MESHDGARHKPSYKQPTMLDICHVCLPMPSAHPHILQSHPPTHIAMASTHSSTHPYSDGIYPCILMRHLAAAFCYGTHPYCDGIHPHYDATHPLCYGPHPSCDGPHPFCYGSHQLCDGTHLSCGGIHPSLVPSSWTRETQRDPLFKFALHLHWQYICT